MNKLIVLSISCLLALGCASGPMPEPYPEPPLASPPADLGASAPDLAPSCPATTNFQSDPTNCGQCGVKCVCASCCYHGKCL